MTAQTAGDDGIAELTSTINAKGLGPTTSVTILPGRDARTPDTILVELDQGSRAKGRVLARWLTVITLFDAIAGKFHDTDRGLRLSLRGTFPSGGPVIVVATFDERTETDQVDLITAQIHHQRIPELVGQLAAIECEGAVR